MPLYEVALDMNVMATKTCKVLVIAPDPKQAEKIAESIDGDDLTWDEPVAYDDDSDDLTAVEVKLVTENTIYEDPELWRTASPTPTQSESTASASCEKDCDWKPRGFEDGANQLTPSSNPSSVFEVPRPRC